MIMRGRTRTCPRQYHCQRHRPGVLPDQSGSRTTDVRRRSPGKAAVLGMSRHIAAEGGVLGIRCNTIAPGWVQTAATAAVADSMGATTERILQRLAIKRLGTPKDIAHAAVFLASDESTWVTGANFSIDGGAMAI